MPINILAPIVIAVMSMVVGFIWYSMSVFGKSWMKEVGFTESDLKSGPGMGYLLTMVASLVMGVVFALFFKFLGLTSVTDGLFLAVLAWVGFVMPTYAATYVFTRKSIKLFLIDTGYFLVNFLVAGVVVALVK